MFRRVAILTILVVIAPLACQRDSSVAGTKATSKATPTTQPLPPAGDGTAARGVRDGDDPALGRKADGHVVRHPDTQTVIIDLGVGDRVTSGMIFDVYDAQAKIPAADAAVGKDVPDRKATAEVIRVMPGYSECRVLRRTPGSAINIGDLIAARPARSRGPD